MTNFTYFYCFAYYLENHSIKMNTLNRKNDTQDSTNKYLKMVEVVNRLLVGVLVYHYRVFACYLKL